VVWPAQSAPRPHVTTQHATQAVGLLLRRYAVAARLMAARYDEMSVIVSLSVTRYADGWRRLTASAERRAEKALAKQDDAAPRVRCSRKLEPWFDTEPQTYATDHGLELLGRQRAEVLHQPYGRKGNDALDIERTWAQKTNRSGGFVSGASKTRGVRHYGNQGSILVSARRTEN